MSFKRKIERKKGQLKIYTDGNGNYHFINKKGINKNDIEEIFEILYGIPKDYWKD